MKYWRLFLHSRGENIENASYQTLTFVFSVDNKRLMVEILSSFMPELKMQGINSESKSFKVLKLKKKKYINKRIFFNENSLKNFTA